MNAGRFIAAYAASRCSIFCRNGCWVNLHTSAASDWKFPIGIDMKTNRTHRFEKIFYAALAGVLGASIGYWYAAMAAAEHVHEALK